MKKKQEQKNVFFLFVMILGNGMKKTNVQNYLICLNGQIDFGQNVRVFPISNWTELDVWTYIEREDLEIPSIYFAHQT